MSKYGEPSSPIHLAPKELVGWLASQWRDSVSIPDSPYRLPMLVTMGTRPEARTVVLRKAQENPLEIHFHTDLRSAKVAQLRASPGCLLAWYDPQTRLQLQAWGHARLHAGDTTARREWDPLPAHNGRQYGQVPPPGTPISGPVAPASPEKESGWTNFCVGIVRISQIELLQLSREGNIRCRLEPTNSAWTKSWIAP